MAEGQTRRRFPPAPRCADAAPGRPGRARTRADTNTRRVRCQPRGGEPVTRAAGAGTRRTDPASQGARGCRGALQAPPRRGRGGHRSLPPGARRNTRSSPPPKSPLLQPRAAPTHQPSAAAGKRSPATACLLLGRGRHWAGREELAGRGRLREKREGEGRGGREPTTPHRAGPVLTGPAQAGNLLPAAAAAASPWAAAPRAAPCMGSARRDCPRERRREGRERVEDPSGTGEEPRLSCGEYCPAPACPPGAPPGPTAAATPRRN